MFYRDLPRGFRPDKTLAASFIDHLIGQWAYELLMRHLEFREIRPSSDAGLFMSRT